MRKIGRQFLWVIYCLGVACAATVLAAATTTTTLPMPTTSTAPETTTTSFPTANGPLADLPLRCGAVLRGANGVQCGIPGEPSPVPSVPCPAGTECRPWDSWFCRCQPRQAP